VSLAILIREFSMMYPGLVEKYKIKYPIEDELLKAMPTLHSYDINIKKPDLHEIMISQE
jgi:hypothetical protein